MRLPYAEVEFESTGRLHEPAQQQAALDLVRSERATDVLVLVHGWNNDMSAARGLFERLTARVAGARDLVPAAAQRRIVVIGVLWPSIRWASEDPLAGGGAGLLDEQSALQAEIAERIEDPQVVARLEQLVPDLETSADARREFLDTLRGQLPGLPDDDEEPPPTSFLQGDVEDVFEQASGPETDFGGSPRGGGAANVGPGSATLAEPATADGGAAGFGFGSLLGGARALLNMTTYYTMKERAGTVGSTGVAQLLAAVDQATLQGPPQARLHLVGHSFGARVVVAAASRHPSIHSVVLLQGAFSHHGLAADYDGRGNDGFFRQVLAPTPRIAGPLLITHTDNDKAVGVAYAIASRLARQRASGLGGPDDLYGGIGRNGALRTPEVTHSPGQLLDVGDTYDLKAGHVYNLKADTYIGSHSDVTGPQVGYAVLTAMVS